MCACVYACLKRYHHHYAYSLEEEEEEEVCYVCSRNNGREEDTYDGESEMVCVQVAVDLLPCASFRNQVPPGRINWKELGRKKVEKSLPPHTNSHL